MNNEWDDIFEALAIAFTPWGVLAIILVGALVYAAVTS